MRTKIIKDSHGGKTTRCKYNGFMIGSFGCFNECRYLKESNHKFVWCKPTLGLRVMNFLSGFNTDSFKGKVLIFVFGFCFGGLFMAVVGN